MKKQLTVVSVGKNLGKSNGKRMKSYSIFRFIAHPHHCHDPDKVETTRRSISMNNEQIPVDYDENSTATIIGTGISDWLFKIRERT